MFIFEEDVIKKSYQYIEYVREFVIRDKISPPDYLPTELSYCIFIIKNKILNKHCHRD